MDQVRARIPCERLKGEDDPVTDADRPVGKGLWLATQRCLEKRQGKLSRNSKSRAVKVRIISWTLMV